MEKLFRKCAAKASPRPLFNKFSQILLRVRYFERASSKTRKNVYFFFRTQAPVMGRIIKNKRGQKLMTSCSSGYKTSSEKFLH